MTYSKEIQDSIDFIREAVRIRKLDSVLTIPVSDAKNLLTEIDLMRKHGQEFIWGENNPHEYQGELSRLESENARLTAANKWVSDNVESVLLYRDAPDSKYQRVITLERCLQPDCSSKWAIRNQSRMCLTKECQFIFEPRPSERTNEFYELCRWDDFNEALEYWNSLGKTTAPPTGGENE